MDKDLCELTLLRLDTELENAIGHRDYYLKRGDFKRYAIWDQEIETILDEIIKIGGMQ